MLLTGILLFSCAAFLASLLIARSVGSDQGKLAASAVLIAWGSMLYGLFLGRNLL